MNLIITPTGKNSYFKKWIKDDCNFDIVLTMFMKKYNLSIDFKVLSQITSI
jgi:hypothetical protein